jgi:ABC-type nitrate/sulfonate/bicarbonate transport system substrate-binding protein
MKDDPTRLEAQRRRPGTGNSAMPTVTLGFIPLTDCAVLAVARERGFAAREGIDLQLCREASWANIRDKVALGYLHGAQMLAGMPIAATLGINQVPMPMIVPFCLNRNGNAISLAAALWDEMLAVDGHLPPNGASGWGEALRRVVARRKSTGGPPLTFGMVYPFSCHNYELRYWLAACGIDPDGDVHLVVIPPPLMVDNLRDGHIDGFCVGEPWNSLGVEAGLSQIIVSKAELWRRGMEKVLGVPAAWAAGNAEIVAALIRALDRAAAWADEPANHAELAILLSRPAYLDLPASLIARALSGDLILGAGREARTIGDFLVLHRDQANCPSIDQALWIFSQMVRWHQVARHAADEAAIRASFRPDIYHAALAGQPWSPQPPARDLNSLEAGGGEFFDGRRFDPTNIDGYLGQFSDA